MDSPLPTSYASTGGSDSVDDGQKHLARRLGFLLILDFTATRHPANDPHIVRVNSAEEIRRSDAFWWVLSSILFHSLKHGVF